MAAKDSLEAMSENLGLIYEASLNPDSWPYALEALCEEFDANKAQLLYIHPEELTFSFASGFGFDPYALDIGASKFRRHLLHDPVALYALENNNEAFSDRRVIDPDVLHQSPMQIEIRDPADMEFLLTIYITEEDLDGTVLILFRGKNQKAFSKEDEIKLTRYFSHLKRASRIHKALAGSKDLECLQTTVLNNLSWGVIIVDDNKNILQCNVSGHEIIEQSDNLMIRHSRLVCLRKVENELLNRSIANSLNDAYEQADGSRFAVKITGANESQPIFFVTTPLRIQKFEEKMEALPISKAHYTTKIPNRRYALMTFCRPYHQDGWSQMLQGMYQLTPAEAALVNKLADNYCLKKAAEALGRSVGTARIQLQSIFEKTGTNRQSSLVRLLMSIPS